ncbi:lyase family protein [Paenibacillus sp. VCA1]|uniref:lyase family protein n=1 Tax=Paenibacillus sp. VCA1 TaxID=3039148 RepID=UPI002870CBB3|nr:lyase family protein [Paenibacillus sp. VCA1]MDR9854026.1 lyase family protein [Paenibacillus sp. VCA1]
MIRIEQDGLGARVLPSHAYYGIRTLRASEKLPHHGGMPVHDELIGAIACVKKAAALAHAESGKLPVKMGKALIRASEEVIEGKHRREIIVDWLQDISGDSLNMNLNEIIANRALELILEDKGNYSVIDPVRHVNMGQTTSGVVAAALRIASHRLSQALIVSIDQIVGRLMVKKAEIDARLGPERLHWQPGTPAWIGRQLEEYAQQLRLDLERIAAADFRLTSGINAVRIGSDDELIGPKILFHLRQFAQIGAQHPAEVERSETNTEGFARLSSAVKHCALNLSNLCGDLRLAVSLQTPGQHPELFGSAEAAAGESLSQVAFQAIGFDHSLGLAAEAGMLDRDAIPPVLAHNLLESLKLMGKGVNAWVAAAQHDPEKRAAGQ